MVNPKVQVLLILGAVKHDYLFQEKTGLPTRSNKQASKFSQVFATSLHDKLTRYITINVLKY